VEEDSVEIGGANFRFGLGRLVGRETGREGRLRIPPRGAAAYVVEPGIYLTPLRHFQDFRHILLFSRDVGCYSASLESLLRFSREICGTRSLRFSNRHILRELISRRKLKRELA
jgi:hypothetical protein